MGGGVWIMVIACAAAAVALWAGRAEGEERGFLRAEQVEAIAEDVTRNGFMTGGEIIRWLYLQGLGRMRRRTWLIPTDFAIADAALRYSNKTAGNDVNMTKIVGGHTLMRNLGVHQLMALPDGIRIPTDLPGFLVEISGLDQFGHLTLMNHTISVVKPDICSALVNPSFTVACHGIDQVLNIFP